ncbi:MAG: ester cyclase [Caulobacteraceae bacterium]|nr:ester cyclase [Caulobacteraceae bacterium]
MTPDHPLKRRLTAFIRDVWDQGDADAADAYLAPAYTIRHDPGAPWEGQVLDPDAFKQRLRQLREAFPDQRFQVQALVAEGDQVAMTWLWSATHTGDLPGFAATGRTVRMSGATVYSFDADQRLTGHWQITDRLGVYQQLQRNLAESGASPA